MAHRSPHVQGSTEHEKGRDRTESVQASFMPFEKPFDDMQEVPDPRSYPKHLERDLPTAPTKELCPRNAKAKEKEHKTPRSWPKPDKNGKPSKRKRDTHGSPLSPTRSTEPTQLERWLDEPVTAGPYHAIDGVVGTKQSYHAKDLAKKRA